MSKRKPARTIKARSASKIRSQAAGSGQPTGRVDSKQAWVLALLCGPNGATIATVTRRSFPSIMAMACACSAARCFLRWRHDRGNRAPWTTAHERNATPALLRRGSAARRPARAALLRIGPLVWRGNYQLDQPQIAGRSRRGIERVTVRLGTTL
jgi:hypothetical protein